MHASDAKLSFECPGSKFECLDAQKYRQIDLRSETQIKKSQNRNGFGKFNDAKNVAHIF